MLDRFYPVVDSADMVARLVPVGVRLIQLRIKDCPAEEIGRQVRAALALCRQHGTQFILNDYWQIALDEGVDYIHLGQEDLDDADIKAIRKAGVRIGISTHSEAELERALTFLPDYIALGPIYPTTLKIMPWAPQGLETIRVWKRRLGPIPLIAIGGITLERASACLSAGADSIAVVSDVVANPDPENRARRWLNVTERAT